MKVLILGGPRQGEFIELAGRAGRDPATWVDLLTGDTYRIRRITWAEADIRNPEHATALFKLPVAVHPSFTAPGAPEQQLAEMALSQVISQTYIDVFMREHAEPQELAPVVPDSPAELIEEGE